MKKVYKDYLNNKIKLEKWQIISIVCSVIVISGVFGWVYEFIFYFINSGFKTFYYRGANFLPWINIYATGSILIYLFTKRFKKSPLKIFLISALVTGILEYIAGFMMLHFAGLRCWDYNTEILNFMNIDGFVCLRSVTFFGISALFLMYFIIPLCIYLSKKVPKKIFLSLSVSLCFIFLFDELYNLIFARIFDLPRAHDVYEELGFKFMNYYGR